MASSGKSQTGVSVSVPKLTNSQSCAFPFNLHAPSQAEPVNILFGSVRRSEKPNEGQELAQ